MSILRVERQMVKAEDVFHNEKSWKGLQDYHNLMKRYEQANDIPRSIEQINAMTVKDGYIPEDLSHQEITGRGLRRQAKYIFRAPFLKAVTSHPEYCDVPGFEIPKQVMKESILTSSTALRSVGNLFRKNKIHTMVGSPTEVKSPVAVLATSGRRVLISMEFYGKLYPAFHARITGQVPMYVANAMENYSTPRWIPVRSGVSEGSASIGMAGFLAYTPVSEVPPRAGYLGFNLYISGSVGQKSYCEQDT